MSGGVAVEFCGLPGAGKSFLAARLPQALRRRGVAVVAGDTGFGPDVATPRRLARKLRLVGMQLVGGPRDALQLATTVASSQAHVGDVAGRYVQWVVTQQSLLHARQGSGFTVFEEGGLQVLWSLGLRGDVEPVLAGVADGSVGWRVGDVVVAVDVPRDVALARLRARTSRHSRIQLLPPAAQEEALRLGEERLSQLLDWLSAMTPDVRAIIPVDGASGLQADEAVDRIADQIMAACV